VVIDTLKIGDRLHPEGEAKARGVWSDFVRRIPVA